MPGAEILAAVTAAADRGDPLRPRDLLRFEAPAVRGLFDSGDITRCEMRLGQAVEVVILPSAPPDEDDSAWSDDELAYLETAYCGGVRFTAMAAALKRPGGEILQAAWRHKWQRGAVDNWGSEIPAWRIARLRMMLDEAERRGGMAGDDGADLRAHRALWRCFARGHARFGGLNRHYHPWSPGDLAKLEAMRVEGRTISAIARALRRTAGAVSTKITELDLAQDQSWTEDEDRIVVAGAERGLSNRQIAVMLPRRSDLAVKQRAQKLCGPRGAELWTEDERAALRKAVASGANLRAFARRIGRGVSGVRWQCRALGLSHPDAVKPYSESEDRRIREGWLRGDDPREVAADLGRPLKGVFCRAFKLGVTRSRAGNRKRIRAFEIEYIRVRVAQGWTAVQIAEKLRRGHQAIYRIAYKNGIRWNRSGPRPTRKAAA